MEQSHAHDERHPGPRKYLVIGTVLAILTGIEVAAFYLYRVDVSPAMIAAVLLLLSAFKFTLVVGYFMHLRFDDLRFTLLFIFPFVIALSVMLVLMGIFGTVTR